MDAGDAVAQQRRIVGERHELLDAGPAVEQVDAQSPAGDEPVDELSGGFLEIRQYTGWSNYRVHTHLRELIELEYVSVETDRATNGHRYRLLYEGQGKDGEKFMLGLTDPDNLN